ncbi:hypothetical protein BKA83DRAFT_4129081 [Pisolithus microcarpus]|nr:hypothetical protein BKA83DRAFT_4129081 [Pisolithus microcarpus]
MYQTIDNTQFGDVKWQSFAVKYTGDAEVDPAPWMRDEYDIWFQDPHKVVQNMLANPKFAKEMDYQPFSTRQNDYYPLYLSIRNICNNVHQAHCNGVTLITFLAMPKTMREHTGKDSFCKFQCWLFHSSLGCILKTFKPGIVKSEVIPFGDGHHWHFIIGVHVSKSLLKDSVPILVIGQDSSEMLSKDTIDDIWGDFSARLMPSYCNNLDENNTLQCCHDHTEMLVTEFSLAALWDEYGIVGELIPFTKTLDVLSLKIIKGAFKDHLVEWVENHTISQSAAFPSGVSFKQWMGDDLKALMKVYLPVTEGHVPKEIIHTFHALLEFFFLIWQNVLTEKDLCNLNDVLARFYQYCEVFKTMGTVSSFSLPQQHAMKHYRQLIQLFGAPNGLCSSITKSKHMKAVKKPYWHTNKYHALGQMLLINQQLDELAASQADFDSSQANEWLSGEDQDSKSECHPASASIDKSQGNYKEHLTSGPAKSAVMVRNKWISHIYQDIEGSQGKSSCHWDNVHGAGVQGKFNEEVFENYAKNHPLICLFKNSGWEFYELMLNIMPNGTLHGNNAFTPSTLNFSTDSAQQVTDHSPAPNGETSLEFPDPSRYSLNISQWCEMLPVDNTPKPPSASGDTISNMLSSQVSPPPPSSSTLPSVGMSNVQFSKVHTPAACVPSSTGNDPIPR